MARKDAEFERIVGSVSHPITSKILDDVEGIADLMAQGDQVHGCKARTEVLTKVIAEVFAAQLNAIRALETEIRRLQLDGGGALSTPGGDPVPPGR